MCLIGWLSTMALFLRLGLGSSKLSLVRATMKFVNGLGDGHPLRGLGLSEVVGLSMAFDLFVLMVGTLFVAAWRITVLRLRQRTVIDLVAETSGRRNGVRLLQHPLPLAYFVPGDGGRVVVSTGAADVLTNEELDAVIAHEVGHRSGRHGSLLIPLQATASFVPFLPLARHASPTMRSYLEMAADDFSVAQGSPDALRGALYKAAWFAPAPGGSLSAYDDVIDRRIRRLSLASASRSDTVVAVVTAVLSSGLLWYIIAAR